jgi:hypothetical protein
MNSKRIHEDSQIPVVEVKDFLHIQSILAAELEMAEQLLKELVTQSAMKPEVTPVESRPESEQAPDDACPDSKLGEAENDEP